MCGIAGLVNGDRAPVDAGHLAAMCDVIRHRGPDEDGRYLADGIGLGVRRLRIIDLATGRQPIHNEDRTVWTVFNGEIYNYQELRRWLEERGHRFYTRTDTECIGHLYEEEGTAGVRRLRGMFAFALWDTRRRRLVLARDRVGVKQLYYRVQDDRLAFGSEIKCLLTRGLSKRAIDTAALRDYFRYLYVPGERTIFEDIRRLPPGHLLVWEDGRPSIERYWRLEPRIDAAADEEAIAEEFRERFRDAVRVRLVSDVPLGAFLSGGIDSSAVVAVMAGLTSAPVKTFTIGYEAQGRLYDERPYARQVAERFGTDHHEFVVSPRIEEVVPAVVRAFDEPFADSSAIPSYYVSELTRTHVTVALSGVGGDEIAGGYERYLGVQLAEYYRRLPRAVRRGVIGPVVSRLRDPRDGRLAVSRLKRFVGGAEYGVPERYRRYVSAFSPEELDSLLRPSVPDRPASGSADDGLVAALRAVRGQDAVTQMIFADFNTYLPDDLLVLTDRLSMAHSLEVRAPFLDHELWEFAATIPGRMKLRGWTKKRLLRKAFAPLLPPEVLTRKKQGFSIPLAAWLRGDLRPFLLDWLDEGRLRRLGWIDAGFVRRLVEEHLASRENHENKLWAVLMFVVWHALYLEGSWDAGG